MLVLVQLLNYQVIDNSAQHLSFGVYYISDEENHSIFDTIQRIREQSRTAEAVYKESQTRTCNC